MGSFIYWIFVGLIAGWATGKIMKGSGYGVFMDIVLGICGGIIGGLALGILGFFQKDSGLIPSIIVATLGAILLVSLTRAIKKG